MLENSNERVLELDQDTYMLTWDKKCQMHKDAVEDYYRRTKSWGRRAQRAYEQKMASIPCTLKAMEEMIEVINTNLNSKGQCLRTLDKNLDTMEQSLADL